MPGFQSRSQNAVPVYLADDNGNPVGTVESPEVSRTAPLPAATDRSGTVGTAAVSIPSNAVRRGLRIQNISTGTIGVNEIGGTAAIGTPGTYTLPANASLSVTSNRAISLVGSAAGLAYTATEY